MGVDIHCRIVKYNEKDNFFHELKLYRYSDEKNDYEYVRVYDNRDYEMFDAMQGNSDYGYGYFPYAPIRFNSIEPALREELLDLKDSIGIYGFYEVSIPEIKSYVNEHPEVDDFDEYDNENNKPGVKANPIKELYQDILTYITFADRFIYYLCDYKLLYYFDC